MTIWPFRRREPETREARSALAQELIDLRASQAAATPGAVPPSVETLAAAEMAAGLWERGLSAGQSDTLTVAELAMVGRALVTRGEAVFYVSDRAALIPVAQWDITAPGARPETWCYRCTMSAPTGQVVRQAAADRVLHFRINVEPGYPWRGRSPWAVASSTAMLARRLERSLSDEESGPVGHVLSVPDLEQAADLPNQIAALAGKVVLGEAPASGWEEGRQRAPGGRDWKPERIGPAPPETQRTLRQDVQDSIMGAAGVPVELVAPRSAGDAREAWRRFLHSTIAPVGRLVGAEARRVLGGSGVIGFDALFASDLQGRARAYRQLVDAGMPHPDARRVCGFDPSSAPETNA